MSQFWHQFWQSEDSNTERRKLTLEDEAITRRSAEKMEIYFKQNLGNRFFSDLEALSCLFSYKKEKDRALGIRSVYMRTYIKCEMGNNL